jgi:hypothetical protein
MKNCFLRPCGSSMPVSFSTALARKRRKDKEEPVAKQGKGTPIGTTPEAVQHTGD